MTGVRRFLLEMTQVAVFQRGRFDGAVMFRNGSAVETRWGAAPVETRAAVAVEAVVATVGAELETRGLLPPGTAPTFSAEGGLV